MIYLIIIIVVVILVFVIIKISRDDTGNRDNQSLELDEFKKNSEKIKVDLSNCTFKTNTWTTERVVNHSVEIGVMNQLSGYQDSNIRTENQALTSIELKINYNAKEYTIKKTLGIELDRLRIWFALQKETDLYIQKQSKEKFLKGIVPIENINNTEIDLEHTEDVLFYDEIYVYEYYLDLSFIEEN